MLSWPLVLFSNAPLPNAIFMLPSIFDDNASSPIATLLLPEVVEVNALTPIARFAVPVVKDANALWPIARPVAFIAPTFKRPGVMRSNPGSALMPFVSIWKTGTAPILNWYAFDNLL